jgi:hypothetical protein
VQALELEHEEAARRYQLTALKALVAPNVTVLESFFKSISHQIAGMTVVTAEAQICAGKVMLRQNSKLDESILAKTIRPIILDEVGSRRVVWSVARM